MPKVTTIISYEHEEYGKGETSCYSREVDDLDYYDWLWYLVKQTELMGFDCSQLQTITSDGKMYQTDW